MKATQAGSAGHVHVQPYVRAGEVAADVDGRDELEPTRVAHAVQINRDPNHYARWWDDAGEVVAAIDRAAPVVVVTQS